MNKKRFISLLVVVFVILMVALVPARTILWFVPSTVQLQGIEGTLWSGSAKNLSFMQQPMGQVEWSVAFHSLFSSCIGVNVEQQRGNDHLSARLGRSWGGRPCISHLDGDYDLSRLLLLSPKPLPQFAGRWHLDDVGMWFGEELPEAATGSIAWSGASINLGQVMPLGDYRIDLSTSDTQTGIVFTVQETSGRFDGKMTLTLESDFTLMAKGRVKPRNPKDPMDLQLSFIGQVQNDGSFVILKRFVIPR